MMWAHPEPEHKSAGPHSQLAKNAVFVWSGVRERFPLTGSGNGDQLTRKSGYFERSTERS
jgi:hypothetical protein